LLPVDILQMKRPDLAGAETINGKQHKDGTTPHIPRPVCVDTSDQTFNV
jgi:hypothetical protein